MRAKTLTLAVVLCALSAFSAHAATASYYGGRDGFCGRRTANGERLNCAAMTAAHRTLPFGTYVRVTHAGRSVVVRINDRGPFVRGRDIDLSLGAAQRIGCSGVCSVQLTITERPRVPHKFDLGFGF